MRVSAEDPLHPKETNMSIAHQNAHTIIRDILSKQHIERVWFVGCG
ncbi:SIS domain-containing protein, partial [Escherichia coli]|nr:SIS domain-containing protein [Escherichia coli]